MHCNCESIEQLLNLVRKYTKDFELNEAVEQAVNECIHDNILSDFLRANKAEEDALSLVDLGLSVEQIATALKIDLKTIQKWIEQNPQS